MNVCGSVLCGWDNSVVYVGLQLTSPALARFTSEQVRMHCCQKTCAPLSICNFNLKYDFRTDCVRLNLERTAANLLWLVCGAGLV
jgi:hypothetical protein